MYAPLKVTTDYSLLKSLIKVPDLITFLCDNNIKACGICDENLYGVLDFYESCKKASIKPIIGFHITLNEKDLYLYAKNYEGYKNLIKINTIKETRDVSQLDIEKYHDNLLFIVPFKSKDIYYNLNYPDVYMSYSNLYEKNNSLVITKNSVYVEDLRALKLEDLKYMEYLDFLRKEEKQDYSSNYYHNEDFIDNEMINEVIEKLNVEMPSGNRYIPKYNNDVDSTKFLRSLANAGLNKRMNGKVTDIYQNRLDYELSIIEKMGFVDYFLIVYDYVLYAKKNDILVGPGRGSAAGSLVSFAIGIIDIDPIKYNLLFERFLNPARVTMPDIDIDFDANKREMVIDYVRCKYGKDKVALGLTFNTLKSKLVLREVGKLLNINSDLIDKFVRSVNGFQSLKGNLENDSVKKFLHNYKELKEVYNISMHLENLKKNVSTHAAGVVISSVSIDEVIPIHLENDTLVTGITMEYLENIGLLKMDFLGLKNLTTIANITKSLGKNVLKHINLEDELVLELFKKGKTEGIFQFETPMMKILVTKLKPNSFSDLVAGVALGRPGPKDHAEEFILRKEGKAKVTYIHPDLENILKETYGVLIYQEQIIAILGKIGGYSYQEADLIRRAISKKKDNVLKEEEEKFIKRAVANGYSSSIAKEIYDLIVKFANYGFNKSHSVAYALIAYQMAYLKVYYPAQFFVELLNNGGTNEKKSKYLSYLKGKNISFYKPSVNESKKDYVISEKSLIMPLWLIKNITKEISNKILEVREDKFLDIFDFCYKTKDFMNRQILEALINAGALDCFDLNHQTMINNIDNALNYAELADDAGTVEKPIIVLENEYSSEILRKTELESYGFYITNHPASKYSEKEYMKLINLEKFVFKKIKTVVLVEKINKIKTKKNEDMAFFTGNDETGNADFTVFPNSFKLLAEINNDDLVEVFGEVSKRFDKYSIIVNNIRKVG